MKIVSEEKMWSLLITLYINQLKIIFIMLPKKRQKVCPKILILVGSIIYDIHFSLFIDFYNFILLKYKIFQIK